MTRTLRPLAVALVALSLGFTAFLSACKKEDLTPLKNQGLALAKEWAPKLGDLTGKLDGLLGRVKGLPIEIPGVGDLLKKLEGNKAIVAKASALLGDLPGKLEAAIGKGSAAEATAAIEAVKTAATGAVDTVGKDVAAAETMVGDLEKKATEAAAAAAAPAGFMFDLPGGGKLEGADKGVEAMLIAFITDAAKPVDKTTWFDFDRLTFNTGSADLDMDKSKAQLDNIKLILTAFPKVSLKLGGYTDNSGDAKANKKLSQDRADAVMKALVGMGIDAKRLAAEGYGDQFPVCAANDTDECKAKNRRIAVRVSAK